MENIRDRITEEVRFKNEPPTENLDDEWSAWTKGEEDAHPSTVFLWDNDSVEEGEEESMEEQGEDFYPEEREDIM